ncbi:MAG: SRPBCC family protein [Bryobacteraceae bacterium]
MPAPKQYAEALKGAEIDWWAPIIAGGSLIAYGVGNRSKTGLALAFVGGSMIYAGLRRPASAGERVRTLESGASGFHVQRSVTVNKGPEELYRFWRKLENLPHFMKHLESVEETGASGSHWVARGPAGTRVEWDAEIIAADENRRIAWRSLEGSDVDHTGSVEFRPAPGNRGTEVHVSMQYRPPAGALGKAFAWFWGEEPSQQIAGDLRRFKQLMETGEVTSTQGQSSGRTA